MKRFLTFLLLCVFPVSLSIAETDRIENQAELFLSTLTKKHVLKSGTPDLIKLLNDSSEQGKAFKSAYLSSGRPSKDTFADLKEGHFRVHYDIEGIDAPDTTDVDMNGVPDYVDSVLVYLEYAWDKLVALGYEKPRSDASRGGSEAVDCYIEDLEANLLYGFTSPDNNGILGMLSAYITIDNNYTDAIYHTTEYDGLKITTAHEFFHVVHFSYFGGHGSGYWMEHSSVWFEDYVWDDINDYLFYTDFFFSNRNKPIDTYNGTFEYGASLFAFHIAEQYGVDMIRQIWSIFKENQSAGIELMDSVLPDGLNKTLSDLAVWSYFTGYRANSQDFFSEAHIIEATVTPERFITSIPAEDSLEFSHYTFKYVEITPEDGFTVGDTLKCDFESKNGGTWKKSVILYNSPKDYAVEPLNWQQPSIYIARPFEKAVLVMTNTNTSEKQNNEKYMCVFKIDITSPLYVNEKSLPSTFALHQNYPNPFNPATAISYTVPYEAQVKLHVININGQIVQTLEDGTAAAGIHSLIFDGSNFPSGIYFLHLISGKTRLTEKMTLLK